MSIDVTSTAMSVAAAPNSNKVASSSSGTTDKASTDASFKNEMEKRITLMSFFSTFYDEKPKYNMESWGIREYYPLKISNKDDALMPGLIEEIMIGPRAYYPEGVFERYLESLGINNILITYSKCPLR